MIASSVLLEEENSDLPTTTTIDDDFLVINLQNGVIMYERYSSMMSSSLEKDLQVPVELLPEMPSFLIEETVSLFFQFF